MNLVKTKKGTELPLISLQGKPYLQVQHRIVWFREENPNWGISTSFHTLTENIAIAFATIKNEKGEVMATAHKQENPSSFADYIEKAETGAIGRALALVGYGTAFAIELDEGSRIVDAPTPPKTSKPAPTAQPKSPVQPKSDALPPSVMSRQELGSHIVKYAKALNVNLDAWVFETYKKNTKDLTTNEMISLFEDLGRECGRAGVVL